MSNYDDFDDLEKTEDFETVETANSFDNVDDTGKTQEQILAESGVTQEEIDKTFPADYEPLGKTLSEMTEEEKSQKMAETSARLSKIRKASSEDAVDMPPNMDLVNAESISLSENMQEMVDAVQLLRSTPSKSYPNINQLTENLETAKSLLGFDAKSAQALWLSRIRKDSNITGLLALIQRKAASGSSEVVAEYVSTYDKIQLKSLGFLIARESNRSSTYKISWGIQ